MEVWVHPHSFLELLQHSKQQVWVHGSTDGARYRDAVKMAEAAYGVASAENPIFVRWVVNPEQMESNFWHIGISVMLVGVLIQQLVLFAVTVGVNTFVKAQIFFR
jgi:hypothetical protein